MDHISLKNAYGFKNKGKRTWQNIFLCVVAEPKTFERYFETFKESKIKLNLSSHIKKQSFSVQVHLSLWVIQHSLSLHLWQRTMGGASFCLKRL